MYFRKPYVELTRAIGYAEVPVADVRKRIDELVAEFGKDVIQSASNELVDIVEQDKSPIVRLKPQVRKLAWQLLGPPPEYESHMNQPIDFGKEEPKKPIPKRPSRKLSAPKKPEAKKVVVQGRGTMMDQYRDAKERHPNMLLLFRMGDFYESFDADARSLSRPLGLTLTTRDKTMPMAGFPYHQLECYLPKLLAAASASRFAIRSRRPREFTTRPGKRFSAATMLSCTVVHNNACELDLFVHSV